jgi:Fe-Mn family superoxide dismutase
MVIDRRTLLGASGAILTSGAATIAAAAAGPRPLSFDPASIAGLSEKLLTSHHANNYTGAVKRLALIEAELDAGAATMPGFRLNGLKREALIAYNSMVLHEIYFASFAGTEAPDKRLSAQMAKDFGSLDAWRAEAAAMGKALAGGSGWVLLSWSPRLQRLRNDWAADHTMTAADGAVLYALDLYEHAYAMDYGANAGAYVDAALKAQRWSFANERFKLVAS